MKCHEGVRAYTTEQRRSQEKKKKEEYNHALLPGHWPLSQSYNTQKGAHNFSQRGDSYHVRVLSTNTNPHTMTQLDPNTNIPLYIVSNPSIPHSHMMRMMESRMRKREKTRKETTIQRTNQSTSEHVQRQVQDRRIARREIHLTI